MIRRTITSSHVHTTTRRSPIARLAIGFGLVGAACQYDGNGFDPGGPITCADPASRRPGQGGDEASGPARPPFPADLGGLGATPGHAPLEPIAFDLRSERAADGGVAHIAELTYETSTGATGRLELTTLPGRGAALALVFEGRLALGIVDGAAPVPAPFADREPRLSHRRGHGHAELVEGYIHAIALREATTTDYLALALAAPELSERLSTDPSRCPGCSEALDRLGWSWMATLRSACRDGLSPTDLSTCTIDLWARSPDIWW